MRHPLSIAFSGQRRLCRASGAIEPNFAFCLPVIVVSSTLYERLPIVTKAPLEDYPVRRTFCWTNCTTRGDPLSIPLDWQSRSLLPIKPVAQHSTRADENVRFGWVTKMPRFRPSCARASAKLPGFQCSVFCSLADLERQGHEMLDVSVMC
jgi:hypothetical protein